MTNKIHQLQSWAETNKQFLKTCFLSVLFWGLVAHGFMFMHWDLSHDSLSQFYSVSGSWRYALGRIFVPLYVRLVRANLTLPWLVGIYALVWLCLAAVIVCSLFSLRSKWKIFIVSGLLVANECVTALTGTYMSDLDGDMLAFFLAAAAVYCWRKKPGRGGFLEGTLLLSFSLGLYQSFLSSAVTLILILLVTDVFDRKELSTILRSGLRALAMLVCGGILYVVWLKCSRLVTSVSLMTGQYNSLTTPLDKSFTDFLRNIVFGWANTVSGFIRTPSLYNKTFSMVLNGAICLITVVLFFALCRKRALNTKQKLLAFLLSILIPVGMDVSFVLAGFSHDLMRYAYCFFGVLLLVFVNLWQADDTAVPTVRSRNGFVAMAYILLCLALLGNVMTSNALYVKKDLEAKATLALYTRIADRIESMDGYTAGETPVVFIGHPDALLETIPGFDNIYAITGSEYRSASNTYYQAYFENVLQRPIHVVQLDEESKDDEFIKEMPSFPDQDSVQWHDGKVIVKLSN